MERPSGVTAISILFVFTAGYLIIVGTIMLVSPGAVSMAAGAGLLGGLELAGPIMFLLIGAIVALIAYGLIKLNNWARRIAILIVFVGVVMLIPSVSGAVVSLRAAPLLFGGVGVIVRVMIIWYLFQEPVKERFLA